MKVLLINPPYMPSERYGKDVGKFGPTNEPMGLAYLAAALEQNGDQVEILDTPALQMSTSDISRYVPQRDHDIIGVPMLTPMYHRSVEVIQAIRRLGNSVKIVAGGPHPTILPFKTMVDNPEIDFVVLGEGERTIVDLVNCLKSNGPLSEIPGLGFRGDGNIYINERRKLISDLDSLPLPARHLLPMNRYHMTKTRTQTAHSYTVIVGRGCPFRCAYCSRILGRKFRHHSTSRIVEEMGVLIDQYGAKEINLEADTITLNKKFILKLCEEIVGAGFNRKIRWTCESRVDTVNKEMLTAMKEAGCWQISYGVETGSQRLLDVIQKGTTIQGIEDAFKLTKHVGISIRAFFMLGLPTETYEESLRTISFAKKLDARWSQFTVTTPFPGTKLYDIAIAEGTLRSSDWKDFKTHGGWTEGRIAYAPKGRTPEELKRLQKRAVREFYLRPRVFFRLLKSVDSFGKFVEYLTGFTVLLKTYFKK